MILCPTFLLAVSEKLFGGINGDVVGAANEITRALVIVALVTGSLTTNVLSCTNSVNNICLPHS